MPLPDETLALLDRMPEPVLLLGSRGETVHANSAFHALAARMAVPPLFGTLFGPPAQVLLSEAARKGTAMAYLPLVCGEDLSHGYRAQIVRGPEEGTWLAMLVDLKEEVEWRHQLFRRNTELSVLNEIGMALTGAIDLHELAVRIWRETSRIMHCDDFSFTLRDERDGSLRYLLWVSEGVSHPEKAASMTRCEISEAVLASGEPLMVNGDVYTELESCGVHTALQGCRSLLAVPLVVNGLPSGVLVLADFQRENRYGRDEVGLMSVIATQAAVAVQTAKLFENMRRAHEELSRTQAQLLEAERVRGVTETVGALNHEVNNPLATIAGTAQLLLRSPSTQDTGLRDRLERILSAAKRIQEVTSRMGTLIQASSRPYPGNSRILDVRGSRTRDDATNGAPSAPAEGTSGPDGAALDHAA